MITRKILEQLLIVINARADRLGMHEFEIDDGPQGRVRLVDHKGRGVLGCDTGLGMASVSKRELHDRMQGFLAALEQVEITVAAIL